MSNAIIRTTAKTAGVPLWKVANEMFVSEATMTRKLRKELPANEQHRILEVIARIAAPVKEMAEQGAI